MSGFVAWKFLNKSQIQQLEENLDSESIKSLLQDFFYISHIDPRKLEIETDFHYYNYAFCKQQAFDEKRTSTFMSLMNEIFITDSQTTNRSNTMTSSFQFFQQLLLKHSVERPPSSIKVFDEVEVVSILEYAMESYFRQYMLFKYVFCPQERMFLSQSLPQEIECPTGVMYSLSEGMQIK